MDRLTDSTGKVPIGVVSRTREGGWAVTQASWDAVVSWFVHGNLIVAGVAAAGALGSQVIVGQKMSGFSVLAAAAGALAVYQLERNLIPADGDLTNHPDRWRWSARRAGLLVATTLAAATGLLLALTQLSLAAIAASTIPVAAVVAYFELREWRVVARWAASMKSILIAGAWAVATATIPLLDIGAGSSVVLWLTAYRFFYFLPAVLLPDLADTVGDRRAGRSTLATLCGHRQVVCIVIALIALLTPLPVIVDEPRVAYLLAVDLTGLWILGLVLLAGAGGSETFLRRTVDLLALWPILTFAVANVGA